MNYVPEYSYCSRMFLVSISVIIISFIAIINSLTSPGQFTISGPGLLPDKYILPCRYFFIQSTSSNSKVNISKNDIEVSIIGEDDNQRICRAHTELLQISDGYFLVRYKLYYSCHHLEISVKISGEHVANSPARVNDVAHPDTCNCPQQKLDSWLETTCPDMPTPSQMKEDLDKFSDGVDMRSVVMEAKRRLSHGGSQCWCHYAVKNGLVYRQCFGQHVGFNMFWDNVLGWLARRAKIPDLEIIVNLGDWPLIKTGSGSLARLPMISWCGSEDTEDMLVPTYELTEASIECMGRQSLDVLASLGRNEVAWEDKVETLFWRGRDSNRNRLKLAKISKENSDLINASITAFFFFRDEEAKLGKSPHVPFFDFFNYKYQLCIDGTVAAYRLPYLLAGGSVVFKQESKYYEHYYKDLHPWKHFIPVKEDLSDLVEKIEWAKNNDAKARKIAENARQFAINNLLPDHVLCYHGAFLDKWSKLISNKVEIGDEMELVQINKNSDVRFKPCSCKMDIDIDYNNNASSQQLTKDEL